MLVKLAERKLQRKQTKIVRAVSEKWSKRIRWQMFLDQLWAEEVI